MPLHKHFSPSLFKEGSIRFYRCINNWLVIQDNIYIYIYMRLNFKHLRKKSLIYQKSIKIWSFWISSSWHYNKQKNVHITECQIYSSKGSVKFLNGCSSQEDSRLNSMILVQHEPIGYNLMDAGSVQIIMFTMTKENLKRPLGLIWGWSNRWIWLLIILFGVSQYCSLIYNAFYTIWSTFSNNPSKDITERNFEDSQSLWR